jgi:NAD(P)-dependent dehydrogenase (short-subunit alcohol dehydrogenase family)
MTGLLLYEPPAGLGIDGLEDELCRAFTTVRDAVVRGDAVVVALDEGDVEGVGDPVGAALAHALLGLVRALATEGAKPGWRINALAAPRDLAPEQREAWIERLSQPAGASGTLIRLGAGHLGKVPT